MAKMKLKTGTDQFANHSNVITYIYKIKQISKRIKLNWNCSRTSYNCPKKRPKAIYKPKWGHAASSLPQKTIDSELKQVLAGETDWWPLYTV